LKLDSTLAGERRKFVAGALRWALPVELPLLPQVRSRDMPEWLAICI
jgi:hypothetical protein